MLNDLFATFDEIYSGNLKISVNFFLLFITFFYFNPLGHHRMRGYLHYYIGIYFVSRVNAVVKTRGENTETKDKYQVFVSPIIKILIHQIFTQTNNIFQLFVDGFVL